MQNAPSYAPGLWALGLALWLGCAGLPSPPPPSATQAPVPSAASQTQQDRPPRPEPSTPPIEATPAGPFPGAKDCRSEATTAFCTTFHDSGASTSVLAAHAEKIDINCPCEVSVTTKKLRAQIPIVRDFVNHPYRTRTWRETPLSTAVRRGDVRLLRGLIDRGAHPDAPNGPDAQDKVPLDVALRLGQPAAARALLERGADASLADLGQGQDLQVILLLLDNGADPSTINLGPALRAQDHNALERLLRYSPPLDDLELDRVVKDAEALRLLLDAGLSANAQTRHRTPILHLAAKNGDPQMIELLLDRGAAIDGVDSRQQSALWEAAMAEHTEALRLLASRGADPDHQDRFGKTALHTAAFLGRTESIEVLMELGANVNAVDRSGSHVLEGAIRRDDLATILLLVEGGATFSHQGGPVAVAQKQGASSATITYLRSKFPD
ncbi:MAG: ankyrin repeat domain-containing protein [Deltaproteobacteria bacterium]|nr:MAG: ankyrin repeat domain-containing protein [Deltaproteobacteria bacterium]